jgi:diacylglycerol O-acyltransferase-1
MISITENLKKRLKSATWGNYVFWITFCVVGQPVSLMMYCHDYVVSRNQQAALAATAPGSAGLLS